MNAVAEKAPESQVIVAGDSFSKRTDTPAPASPQTSNLMQALAAAAANPAMDVAKVERLYVMHKEMMEREAEMAFNDAMAKAQAGIRPIAKDRRNDHTKSWYATLAAIVDEITPVYTAEGISISFDNYSPERDKGLPELPAGWVRVMAFVSHRGGHTRAHHLDGPLDDKGSAGNTNKTGIQAMGSTVAYLRRYLVCMIFNVATADDNDGNGGTTGPKLDEKKLADHLANIEAAADEPALLKAFGAAWNAAEELKDKGAQQQFVQMRDARRKLMKGRKP